MDTGQTYLMEELLAYAILLEAEMIKEEDYQKHLDWMFERNMEQELLTELEFCCRDRKKTCMVIYDAFYQGGAIFDFDCREFGRILLEKMEQAYYQAEGELREFGRRAYRVWNRLLRESQDLAYEEPFHVLCYADDPLSWGDEQQTRDLYESVFAFYREKEQEKAGPAGRELTEQRQQNTKITEDNYRR